MLTITPARTRSCWIERAKEYGISLGFSPAKKACGLHNQFCVKFPLVLQVPLLRPLEGLLFSLIWFVTRLIVVTSSVTISSVVASSVIASSVVASCSTVATSSKFSSRAYLQA